MKSLREAFEEHMAFIQSMNVWSWKDRLKLAESASELERLRLLELIRRKQ